MLRRSAIINDKTSINAAYVFKPASVPTLPVAGSQALFPVHRIYCVGRTFADHLAITSAKMIADLLPL